MTVKGERERPLIFLSYSHKDERDKNRLVTQLEAAVSAGEVDLWRDDRIRAGDDWMGEIDAAMSRARVAILLITAHYLTSNFIMNVEVPVLLERHKKAGLRVFPVIARECTWGGHPWLAAMNVRPKDGLPVWRSGGRHVNRELAAISKEVADIIKEGAQKESRPSTKNQPTPDAPFMLVRVPPGVSQMGTKLPDIQYFEKQNWDWLKDWYVKGGPQWEQPHYYINLPAYEIARHPVTNQQYSEFVRATNRPAPAHWGDGAYPPELSDHPVSYVSWHDANEYCRWLSAVTGRGYRLPTEAEWEKSARGGEGHLWPWGNEWDSSKCNSRDYGAGHTLPVTHFGDEGQSPYQVSDMAGNVAEWCSTRWGDLWTHPAYGYPYDASDGRESMTDEGLRVVRGGSFKGSIGDVRGASRSRYQPDKCLPTIGFRVACEPD